MDDENIPMSKTKVISQENIEDNSSPPPPQNNNEDTAPSSLVAIIFFIIITTLFSIVTYFLLPNKIPTNNNEAINNTSMYFIIYVLVLVIGNYFINLDITRSVCGGAPQWAATMMNTIIPWILIFGVINIILIIFPGWISPFANTFGYSLMNMLGLNDLLNIILSISRDSLNQNEEIDENKKLVARGIQEIYGNSSLFVNQIPIDPENFRIFVGTLIKTGYFRQGLGIDSQEIINLYKLIQLKEIGGKYIWNILTGILVTSVSYNFIINTACNNSVKQMQEKRNNFLIAEKNRQNARENNRTYYPFVIGETNPDVDVKSSSFSTTHD